jgi:endonuclease/exonuclease/phosphatase family metal-dependent hydrolase
MKTRRKLKPVFFILIIPVLLLITHSCEFPATNFDDEENAILYSKGEIINPPQPDSTVRIMTWNIRFGIGRGPWFGDACGYKVIYSKAEIITNLTDIAKKINSVKPDILLLQEVDINSTRSAYADQLQWLLDHTYFNYAAYGSQWKAQFIPSDGLGRMNEANAILSRWPLTDAKRIQLELRQDQDKLTRYFYERCCMVKAKVSIPGFKNFYAVNIHASAFATDDTKHQHIVAFKKELDNITATGNWFVAGGDLNTLPPNSDSTDYCYEDMCQGESFHQPGDDPQHKEGSNYTPESEWLVSFYSDYQSAVELNDYHLKQPDYFTHTTRPEHTWDRTLDYLFTNNRWRNGSTVVHQDFFIDSDHAPVSAEFVLIKNK